MVAVSIFVAVGSPATASVADDAHVAAAPGLANVIADGAGWHHGDVGVGWWIVMTLGMAAFWGAVIVVVVSLARGTGSSRNAAAPPLELLRRRLASGELSIEEFERRRALLEPDATADKDLPG